MEEKKLPHRSIFHFPFFEEEMWGMNNSCSTGFSISEDKKHIYVEANVPGVKLDDIELSLDKGMLWIRGEKKEEKEDKDKKFYRKSTSSFWYRIPLPQEVDDRKEPEASYENGVIKITFNKANQSSAKKISIRKK